MSRPSDAIAVLRKRVAKIPLGPGVYRWIDAKGNVLYVGKAKSLRKRMQTYVNAKAKNSAWTEIMVRQIADFETTVVPSELEALMLESNLIKELQPKYNIMLKDDKGYTYVRVGTNEPYPRIEIVRRMAEDKARYFGPFTSGMQAIERTIEMLDSILHFRACRKSLDLLSEGKPAPGAPCLEYQIGRCIGLCIGEVSAEDYNRRIKAVISFFRGNFSDIKREAKDAMRIAAEQKKFEKAARLRDALGFIDDLEKRQAISDTSGEDIDVFGLAERGGKRQVVLLRQRDGKLIEELSFVLKGEAENSSDAMSQFLPQFYKDTQDIPSIILVRDELPERNVLEEWLKVERGTTVRIATPERGRKSKLLEMAENNAEEKVEQQFAAWEAEIKKVEGALAGLVKLLGLPKPPKRIEGYDISHLGGTATVGSMVVFEYGKAKREHYRSFNIVSVAHGDVDDYKALTETLKRRLKYLTEDLETLEEKLKEQGMILRKARKADQPEIERIVKEHPKELDDQELSYKEFLVVEKKKMLVTFGRLHEHKGGVTELSSIFVSDSERGAKLGRTIARFLLEKSDAKKIYAVLKSELEEYYAELGFQVVRTAPEVIEQKAKSCSERSTCPEVLIMMYEARKQKVDSSFSSHPDLLLIDGGKGQLSSAVAVLKNFNLSIPTAGLAKREEEIFLPGQSASLLVPKDSEARFLLQRVRDEAHRFANAKREKRLESTLFHSAIDDMQGIGDITKAALLKRFGSLDTAKKATDEELKEVLNAKQLSAFRSSDSAAGT